MKRLAMPAAALAAFCCQAGSVEFSAGTVEVLIPPKAFKSVRFAADEMTNFLSRVLGGEVPIATQPSPSRVSIVLGTNDWTEAEGFSTAGLPRDGFRIRVKAPEGGAPGRIFIAGVDDPLEDFAYTVRAGRAWTMSAHERATLFGVYEFLEKVAGVRFFFPGDIGTVVPKHRTLKVPAGEIEKHPAFTVRDVCVMEDGEWPGQAGTPSSVGKKSPRNDLKALNWLRLRLQTTKIPCVHGSTGFMYPDRFLKTHPEYFPLRKDPKTGEMRRDNDYSRKLCWNTGQLCWSSGVVDEMYLDCKSYLTGEDASVRGIKKYRGGGKFGWNNTSQGKYVDIMPQDGYSKCFCDKCLAMYETNKFHWASRLIWTKTAEIGRRLKADGVPGYIVQMAYTPYAEVPEGVDIPDNVLVMVAKTGPWTVSRPKTFETQLGEIKAWSEKLGHKVWLWTYPHKVGGYKLKDVPCIAPRAWYRFYSATQPYSDGAFCETECDRFVFMYLNYYVFAKLGWNAGLDVERLLDDHHEKMFGAAAPEMKEFYDSLEECWMKIAGNELDTPSGPVAKAPSIHVLAMEIYSPERLARWRKLFDRAAGKTAADPDSARRVAFFKSELLEPLAAVMSKYSDNASVKKAQAERRRHPPKNILKEEHWGGPKVRDTSEFVSAPDSLHVVSTNTEGFVHHTVKYVFTGDYADLKPNTRYRVSFFMKIKNIRASTPGKGGGVFVDLNDGAQLWGHKYPVSEFVGTIDWTHHSFECRTGPKLGKEPYLCFRTINANGDAWYDDIIVEELEDLRKEDPR